MQSEHKKHLSKIHLAPRQQQTVQRALKPILRQLGLQAHLTTITAETGKGGQLCVRLQPHTPACSLAEVESAIFKEKLPARMTAKDLAAIPADSATRKNETALHLVLSNGHYPRGLCKLDLLETRGANKRRAIFAFFENFRTPLCYPADVTAGDLAAIKSYNGGTLLHSAAARGAYPANTTVQDLTLVRDKDGATPLHAAATFGHLPPCSMRELKSVKDNENRTPWDIVVGNLGEFFSVPDSVRNLLACPELAQKLNPKRKIHQKTIELLLKSPLLTLELRQRFAIHPKICAAML
jgi:hypothetical protein